MEHKDSIVSLYYAGNLYDSRIRFNGGRGGVRGLLFLAREPLLALKESNDYATILTLRTGNVYPNHCRVIPCPCALRPSLSDDRGRPTHENETKKNKTIH